MSQKNQISRRTHRDFRTLVRDELRDHVDKLRKDALLVRFVILRLGLKLLLEARALLARRAERAERGAVPGQRSDRETEALRKEREVACADRLQLCRGGASLRAEDKLR